MHALKVTFWTLYISVSAYYPVAAAYFSTLIFVCWSTCVRWWRVLGLQRYSLIIPAEKQTARGRNTMLLARRAADSISGVVVRAGVWGLAEAEGLSWGLAVSPPLPLHWVISASQPRWAESVCRHQKEGDKSFPYPYRLNRGINLPFLHQSLSAPHPSVCTTFATVHLKRCHNLPLAYMYYIQYKGNTCLLTLVTCLLTLFPVNIIQSSLYLQLTVKNYYKLTIISYYNIFINIDLNNY